MAEDRNASVQLADVVVLIVNRSPETLVLLRDVVEETGMAAIARDGASFSGEELLAYIAEHRPQAVLYDIPAPYDANLKAFQELRADPRSQGCGWVALSTSSSVVHDLADAGECAVLGKPFDLDELMSIVTQQVEAHRERRP